MRTFRAFMSHKFTYRQSLLIIGASILAGFIADRASTAAGLPNAAITGAALAAAIATFIPMQIVFYRRAHA